jgi:hypothetical protein
MPSQNRRKTIGTKKQFDRVLVVTEGRKTEPLYLNCFKKYFRYTALETHSTSDSSPERLLRQAIERSNINKHPRRSVNSSYFLLPFDSVWIVFDKNGNDQELIKNVVGEAGRKIKIAFSQPCFELWLLLHFVYSTRNFSNCQEVAEALKKHDSSYSKNGNFEKYMPKIEEAIKNSKNLHQFVAKINGLQSKSYTTVYKLIEDLHMQVQKNGFG